MATVQDLYSLIAGFIELGGVVVAILLVMSVIAVAVILAKGFQFWRAHVGWRSRAQQAVALWNEGRPREALDLASAGRSASARAVSLAISMKTDRRLEKPEIEERIARHVAQDLHDLQSGFRLLDAIAQVAPLLG